MDYSRPVSSVLGILQARIVDGLPCPPQGGLPIPGIKPESLASSALACGSLPHWHVESKESPANAGHARDTGSILGLGRSPGGGNGNLLQYSGVPGESHRHRILMDYSLWGCKESDTTE